MRYKSVLESLSPYETSERWSVDKTWTFLDWNESPYPASKIIISTIQNYNFELLNSYPDISNSELKKSISEYINYKEDYIEVYAGSDAALVDIFTVFVDNNTCVLTFQPTYSQVDTFINLNTTKYLKENIIDPLGEHTYKFKSEMFKKSDVVYICNPNNPTGKLIPSSVILNLIEENPDKLFIVDEAYIEFAGNQYSCLELTGSNKNLIVVRTFSKAFGLAGIRLGYVISHPDTLKYLRLIKNTKSVSRLSQVVGIAALMKDNLDYVQKNIEKIKLTRDNFILEMNNINGYSAFHSNANFVLLRVEDREAFTNILYNNKILVRNRSNIRGIEGCFRVSIGREDMMNNLINILKDEG